MRLRRLTAAALATGAFAAELEQARARRARADVHALPRPAAPVPDRGAGVLRPATWTLFAVGALVAVSVALALTLHIPRLYPRAAERK